MSSCATPLPFNVLFIGAGGIVFGNENVRWDHSVRLERILAGTSRPLSVVGIVDPSIDRYNWVMDRKRGQAPYARTRHYLSVSQAVDDLAQHVGLSATVALDLVILASPPEFRGTLIAGRDLEIQLINAFTSVSWQGLPNLFVEKPVSTLEDISGPREVARRLGETFGNGKTVGVGYMLRYLRVVQLAKRIIHENALVVMSVTARYVTAYQRIRKPGWWNKSVQCGPIVEQSTHFCDLCRYLGGEVALDTVRAVALEHDEPAGKLSHQSPLVDETKIPPEDRIPRVTSAFWKYESGAIGSLNHIIALHGISYSNEIDLVADGYQLRLVDLYTDPKLYVRTPAAEKEKLYQFPGDDPFYNELAAVCNSSGAPVFPSKIQEGAQEARADNEASVPQAVLSSYEDATRTYELSWRIRRESEKKE